jgi:hypothetical protein
MAALPRVSRFLVEHPKTSRFLFRLAHHTIRKEKGAPATPAHHLREA